MGFQEIIEHVVLAVEALGVAAIVLGALLGILIASWQLIQHQKDVYQNFRRFLGRSILLGLELLVAADIIRTVAVTLSLRSVAVLAIIVVIRTFLSWSLELEISGRWPWQKTHPSELSSPEPVES